MIDQKFCQMRSANYSHLARWHYAKGFYASALHFQRKAHYWSDLQLSF